MCAQTEVWSLRESQVQPGVFASDVETVGIAEHCRIAVGARDRNCDQIPGPNLGAAELDIARSVTVDHRRRRLQPGRFLDRTVQ